MLATNEYLEAQVSTASPYQLHMLVINGALRFARQGLEAFETGDAYQIYFALNKSREFVMEMLAGLKPSGDEELVDRLKVLFTFIYRRLALADIEKNPEYVRDAIRILEMHRDTWIELGGKLTSQATLQGPHASNWG